MLAAAPCMRKARIGAATATAASRVSASESVHKCLGHRDFASVEVEAAATHATRPRPWRDCPVLHAGGRFVGNPHRSTNWAASVKRA
jgi:hypothetical protein